MRKATVKMSKSMERKDKAFDKKRGVKENSKRDKKEDMSKMKKMKRG